MKSGDPLSKLKELTPGDLGSKLIRFREPKQHSEAHERLASIGRCLLSGLIVGRFPAKD